MACLINTGIVKAYSSYYVLVYHTDNIGPNTKMNPPRIMLFVLYFCRSFSFILRVPALQFSTCSHDPPQGERGFEWQKAIALLGSQFRSSNRSDESLILNLDVSSMFLVCCILKCRSMISFYVHPLHMHSTCQPGIAQQIDCRTRQKSNCMMRFEEMMSKDMTPDNIAYNTLYARHVHILEHHVITLV